MAGKEAGTDNRPAGMPVEPQPRRPQQPLHKEVAPAQLRVDTVEVAPDDAEAMAAEYYKKRSAYTPVAGKADAVQGRTEPEDGKQTDFAAHFNLRDAVLYSEILKPKFDD